MEFPALRGRSILVVEDEMLIGMHIRSALEECRCFGDRNDYRSPRTHLG